MFDSTIDHNSSGIIVWGQVIDNDTEAEEFLTWLRIQAITASRMFFAIDEYNKDQKDYWLERRAWRHPDLPNRFVFFIGDEMQP